VRTLLNKPIIKINWGLPRVRGASQDQIKINKPRLQKQKSIKNSSKKRKFSKNLSKSEISTCQKQIVSSAAGSLSMCLKKNNFQKTNKMTNNNNIQKLKLDQPKTNSKIKQLQKNLNHIQHQRNIAILGQSLLPNFSVLLTYFAKFSYLGLKVARSNLRSIDRRMIGSRK